MSAGSYESYGKAGLLLTKGNFLLTTGHLLKLNVPFLPLVLESGIAKLMIFKQVSSSAIGQETDSPAPFMQLDKPILPCLV